MDKWILVSPTSMPPWEEEVIITVKDNSGDTAWTYTTTAWWLEDDIWISNNDIVHGDIIAWMPMPKPYREEGEA